jgi:hypothetical protein
MQTLTAARGIDDDQVLALEPEEVDEEPAAPSQVVDEAQEGQNDSEMPQEGGAGIAAPDDSPTDPFSFMR